MEISNSVAAKLRNVFKLPRDTERYCFVCIVDEYFAETG